MEEINYSLDEIGLRPAILSSIESRKQVNPYDENGKLPIFVSPMTCILDENNFKEFENSKAIPIMPVWHNIQRDKRLLEYSWTALTLDEFVTLFVEGNASNLRHYNILIDVANGHMKKLYDYVKIAKEKYGDQLTVMIGNIANPKTYIECCKAGVDYVRIGIGGGSGCLSSVKTGMHSSLFYLLTTIRKMKYAITYNDKTKVYNYYPHDIPESLKLFTNMHLQEEFYGQSLKTITKIVADGGVNTIGKAVKCLALGADYVMCGHMFATCFEAGHNEYYYGQASNLGQMDRFGEIRTYEEGMKTPIERTQSLDDLLLEFENSLRSSMSYAGALTLNEFRYTKYNILSKSEFESFNK